MQWPESGPVLPVRSHRVCAVDRFRRLVAAHSLLLASILIVIGSVRIAATYTVFSFTIDEPGHFACGLEYLSKHVYRYETQHPPLARAMVALAPYLSGIRPGGDPNRNVEGRAVILQSGHPDRTLALMRLGILPFFWLGGWVVYSWGRHSLGSTAGLVAVALFTLLPPVLAHSGLACTDMALAACTAAAFFSLVVWAESPTWKRAIALGVAAALAVLSKFTALIFLPATAAVALLFWLASKRPTPAVVVSLIRERAATFGLAMLTAAVAIWAAYWFSWGKVPAWNLTLPAPEFFDGLLKAQSHNQDGHPAYLLGRYSLKGWWYYFPVSLAVKTPIAFLLLLALGNYTCVMGSAASACRPVLAFCLGILLPSMAGHVDIGVRLVLPIYAGLSIIAALGLVRLVRMRGRGQTVAALLLVWMAISGAACHPDYLSYFNEFAGHDPANVLVDSDLDWGQDTKRLATRLRQLGAQEVSLMLIEPLAQPLAIEDSLRRFYGLPRIKPLHFPLPAEGWNVVSPTVAKTLNLPFRPWYELTRPTEKVGALWLYRIPANPTLPSKP